MEKTFISLTVDRLKITELVNKFDNEIGGKFITLGFEQDHVSGDRLLWASNSEFGDKRVVIKVD